MFRPIRIRTGLASFYTVTVRKPYAITVLVSMRFDYGMRGTPTGKLACTVYYRAGVS
jgi:hypothetical protein